MAAKAPLVCFLLILVARAVLSPGADAATSCDQPHKLEPCRAALLREEMSVTDRCCAELGAQYNCLCEYTRMPNPETHFLRQITQEVGMLVTLACDLEPVSCPNAAAA